MMLAPMPRGSSVGWLGWSRVESRPGSPSVLRNRVTTRHFRATRARSWSPHQLGDGRRHLRGDARRQRGQRLGGDLVREQPLAERPDREMRDRPECRRVVGVHHQPGDLVRLVGYDGLAEKRSERQVGQGHLRRDSLLRTARRQAGQRVARPRRRGPGQQGAEITEWYRLRADGMAVHGNHPARRTG